MLPSIFSNSSMNSLFNDPFFAMPSYFAKSAPSMLRTDVCEFEMNYELRIDMPGYTKDDVKIEIDNGYLTVSAAKNESKDDAEPKTHYLHRERITTSCSRTYHVSSALQVKDITAKLDNGVLTISVPKTPEQKSPEERFVNIA